ncbi:MAG: phytoene/squalene synthase family protein [Streptosporangiales bacterium]
MTPDLRASYRRCARIARRYGKTYAMAARLLPARDRPHVHAVYAFCRLADDIVDDHGTRPARETGAALAAFGDRFRVGLDAGYSTDPVLAAVVRTARVMRIDPECFDRFLASMTMDLTVTGYPTWEDLLAYMDGSAAVIGEMMLPVLRPSDPAAVGPARALGVAFQLTNFLRDVGEDLDLGRVYLPQADLDAFGADPHKRHVTPAWRRMMRYEIARTRDIYAEADQGIAMLPPRSAACVSAARVLYARILDRIEDADYDVFTARARVPVVRKLAVAARCLVRPAVPTTGGSAS